MAARVLHVSDYIVKKTIRESPDLCALYGSPADKAKVEEETKAMIPMAVIDDIVVKVEEENKALKEGLEGLGLSKPAMEMALSLQRFHGKGFKHVSEILGAGLVRNAMTQLEVIQKIEQSIMAADDGPVDEVELANRKLDREYHLRLLAEYRKTYNEVQDASMKQARIAMWRKQEQAVKSRAKAGFAPLMAVQVQSGATVKINEKGDGI